jgi:signal transduction histidine kinase
MRAVRRSPRLQRRRWRLPGQAASRLLLTALSITALNIDHGPTHMRVSRLKQGAWALCLLAAAGAALLPASAAVPNAATPSPPDRLDAMQARMVATVPSPAALLEIPVAQALAEDFEAAGQTAKAGAALNFAAIFALLGGDPARALSIAHSASLRCQAAQDHRCHGNSLNQSGVALMRLNDPYAAIQRFDRAARAFVDAGDAERAAIARLNAANIRFDIDDLAGALKEYETVDRLHGADPGWDPVAMLNSMTQVLIKLGRLDDARHVGARAMAKLQGRARSTGTRWESNVGNSVRGTLALLEASVGNADAALPLYRDYLAAAEASGSPLERYNAHFAFAEGLMKLGRPAQADGHMRVALSLVELTDPAGRRNAYALASQVAEAVGRPTEALTHLRAAEEVRNKLAAATLRSAIADANAQTAVAEREAQVARRDAEWATQRTKWLSWTAAGVIGLVLAGAVVFIRLRSRVIQQQYAAVLAERNRMARELHDTLLQGFTGITMQLRAASRGDAMRLPAVLEGMADEAGRWLSQTRHAVWEMRAADGEALETSLQNALATARTQSDSQMQLRCSMQRQPGPTATVALLRVAQEALSNAARHAQARQIQVEVQTTDRLARLVVSDDGVGFKLAPELSALGGHWGLLGMRERIETLGGAFAVESVPGRGTRVSAEIPL